MSLSCLTFSCGNGWTADAKHSHPSAIKSDLLRRVHQTIELLYRKCCSQCLEFEIKSVQCKDGAVDSFNPNAIRGVCWADGVVLARQTVVVLRSFCFTPARLQ